MARSVGDVGETICAAERALALAPVNGDWGVALTLVAKAAGGWGAHLNRMAPNLGLLSSSTGGISSDVVKEFAARQGTSPGVNQRAAALYGAPVMQVGAESDFTNADEWRRTPFYQDFLLKIDAPYSVYAKLFDSGKDATNITVLRSKLQAHASDSDKAALARLLPSLQTAVGIQRALDERGLQIAMRCLSQTGVAAIICDSNLKIISLSQKAEELMENREFFEARRGKIYLYDGVLQRKLQRAVAFASLQFDDRSASSQINMRSRDGKSVCKLAVTPAVKDGGRVFGGGVFLLPLEEVRSENISAKSNIKLTASEMEIGRHLVRGRTTAEIADLRSVSKATVQTQIKVLNAKFSSSHRGELLLALQQWFGA